MNEESAPNQDAPPDAPPVRAAVPAAAQAAAQAAARSDPLADAQDAGLRRTLVLLSVLGALALAVALVFWQRQETETLRDQVQTAARAREERETQLEQRIATLEQQWALAQSDADPVGGVDPRVRERREALAWVDIERLIELAQLQLRAGAPNSVAIDALSAADARLSRLGGPGSRRVQGAVRNDLARLRAAADVDVPGQVARVDALLSESPSWPVLADAGKSALRPAAPAAPARGKPAEASLGARVRAWSEREFGDIIRIREIKVPEALLLDPVQQELVRERARLGLLALRQGLLSRNERLVQSEGRELLALLHAYFDDAQASVSGASIQIRALVAEAASASTPSIEESLRTVREVRSAAAPVPAPAPPAAP